MNAMHNLAPAQGAPIKLPRARLPMLLSQNADPFPKWAVRAVRRRLGRFATLIAPSADDDGRVGCDIPRADFLARMRELGYEIVGKARDSYSQALFVEGLPMYRGLLGPLARGGYVEYVAEEYVDRDSIPADLSGDDAEHWLKLPETLADAEKRKFIEQARTEIPAYKRLRKERWHKRREDAAAKREWEASPYQKLLQSCYPVRPARAVRARDQRSTWNLPGAHRSGKAAWDVPTTGGRLGGRDAGEALAMCLLQRLGRSPNIGWELSAIVRSMFAKAMDLAAADGVSPLDLEQEDKQSDAAKTFSSQLHGFFNVIGNAAGDGVRFSTLGKRVNVSVRCHIAKANRGLGFDDAAYREGLQRLYPGDEE